MLFILWFNTLIILFAGDPKWQFLSNGGWKKLRGTQCSGGVDSCILRWYGSTYIRCFTFHVRFFELISLIFVSIILLFNNNNTSQYDPAYAGSGNYFVIVYANYYWGTNSAVRLLMMLIYLNWPPSPKPWRRKARSMYLSMFVALYTR